MGHAELTLNKTCRARQELWKRWKELISKVCRGWNAFVCPPPHHLSSLNNVNGSHKERCRWGPTQGAAHAASSDNTMVIRLTGNESGFGGRLNMRVILPSSGENYGITAVEQTRKGRDYNCAQHNTTPLKIARKRAWLLCGFPPTCSGGMKESGRSRGILWSRCFLHQLSRILLHPRLIVFPSPAVCVDPRVCLLSCFPSAAMATLGRQRVDGGDCARHE